jgi:hypothetical protein
VADVAYRGVTSGPARTLECPAYSGLGDLDLIQWTVPCERLEPMPVPVAAAEVHPPVHACGVLTQDVFDEARLLEETLPVEGFEEAYRGDAVRDRDLVGGLLLLEAMSEDVEVVAGRDEAAGQERVRSLSAGVLALEALGEADEERGCGVDRDGTELLEKRAQVVRAVLGCQQQALGPLVCGTIRPVRADHASRESPEVLDERDPKHDRDRPDLADGQRGDILEALDEAAEELRVEVGVRVRHQRDSRLVHAREALEWVCSQARQFDSVPRGQIVPHRAQLLVDQVVVVEEPLGGRRDGVKLPHRGGEHAVVG